MSSLPARDRAPNAHHVPCPSLPLTASYHEADLPWENTAPGIARRLLDEWFEPLLHVSALRTARLLTSELVTNALVHGRPAVTLRTSLDPDLLFVEVVDGGSSFVLAADGDRDGKLEGGWGLRIVAAEAEAWGVLEGTTRVWFSVLRVPHHHL